jgi:uncharacterized protein YndB with AHSA1/START domain
MKNTGTLKLTTRGDREIVMTRVFDAARSLVFEAFSKPELVRQWLLGPPGWSMPVCEIEEMGMGGVHREIVVPERIVATEKFDESWYPGEAVGSIVLIEQGGKTALTQTVLYESSEAREAVLKSPMEQGVTAGYDRLAELLASLGTPGMGKGVRE